MVSQKSTQSLVDEVVELVQYLVDPIPLFGSEVSTNKVLFIFTSEPS